VSLARIIAAKIIVTALFWCFPLLIAPPWVFTFLGLPVPEPMIFARLLGCAYLALLIAYSCGFLEARRGGRALPAVLVGIVSNGTASGFLAVFGTNGAWAGWPWSGQAYMWASLLATSMLTIGLLYRGVLFPATPQPSEHGLR
jgi:ABC-type transport system involved in cytochrome c biogenesis permease component